GPGAISAGIGVRRIARGDRWLFRVGVRHLALTEGKRGDHRLASPARGFRQGQVKRDKPWDLEEDGIMDGPGRQVRPPDLTQMKARDDHIVMLTAYDATMAGLLDRAGIDVLLVGDSLGQVILGLDTTIPVSLDAVIHHTRSVTRGASRSLVVADMPFLTYQ